MITKQMLVEQREAIQEDLCCVLDGTDQDTLDHVCQVVVDQFEILLEKIK